MEENKEISNDWWNWSVPIPKDWQERNKVEGVIDLGLDNIEDRAVGCILGVMIGDILGVPTEGISRSQVLNTRDNNGNPLWHNFFPGQHMGLYHLPARWGMYSDDTNSTLGLASSIVSCKGLWPLHAAHQYGRFWKSKPIRGYPSSAQDVMRAVLKGTDITKTGSLCFPEGSFANGSSMRISPVALAFRNASVDELYEAVRMAVISSHIHPESIDAAFIQAYGILLLLKISNPSEITPLQFLQKLHQVSRDKTVKEKIEKVIDFFTRDQRPDDGTVTMALGSSFQIRASEAQACALWGFVTHWNEPEKCLIDIVAYGGDTDTLCSLAGALCGALYGTKWIPRRWFDNIENGEHGRDYAINLAKELCLLDLTSIISNVTQDQIDQVLKESAALN